MCWPRSPPNRQFISVGITKNALGKPSPSISRVGTIFFVSLIYARKNTEEKLISKINETDDPAILEEVSNLFELHETDTVYQVNDQQKEAIEEAKGQVKSNETLTDEQADKDLDGWLSK